MVSGLEVNASKRALEAGYMLRQTEECEYNKTKPKPKIR
jgi:hypothetical protein